MSFFEPNSCNTHCHVYGPQARFPFAPGAPMTPDDAPKESLFALHDALGLARTVIVHTIMHGYDNSATADAIAARPTTTKGIALVPMDCSDDHLAGLAKAGFVGARFHFMHDMKNAHTIDDVIRFGARLAPLGWHLQFHLEGDQLAGFTPAIRRSPVPVVIDHMAYPDASLGLGQKGFQDLLHLLDCAHVRVKVSGCDRASRSGPPYHDAVPFARMLVERFPDRCLWGTDWPHPGVKPRPEDAVLASLVDSIAPSAAARHALMVANPERLYGF